MRILMITNLYPPHYLGGYELLAQQVARHLSARHQVYVLSSLHGVETGADPYESDGAVSIERFLALEAPFDSPMTIRRWHRRQITALNRERTTNVIGRVRPELIFYWSQLRLTVGPMRAGMESGLPRAFTFNDDNMRGFVARRPVIDDRIFRGNTLEGLDFPNSTVISRYTLQRLIESGVPVTDSEIIHQGVPIQDFPAKDSPGALGDPVRLLYVGQLLDYKGIGDLIAALAHHLPRLNPARRVELTLAGSGPEDFVRSMKQASAASPYPIHWLGKVPYEELPALYRAHDAFVFPSRDESFGLTHLEAAASGLPVLATAAGGHAEMLEHGGNALLFRAGDPADLAARIAELVADPERAARLARTAREIVSTRFTTDRYFAQIEGFLERARSTAARR